MSPVDCPREQDVLDAVRSGRWPHRDPELRSHVAGCGLCADLADVAAACAVEQDAAWIDTSHVPLSEVVWWRAQVRARTEAARAASQPIVWTETLGLIMAVAGVIALGGHAESTMAWATSTLARSLVTAVTTVPISADLLGLMLRGAMLAAAVCLALAPVAVYLATDE